MTLRVSGDFPPFDVHEDLELAKELPIDSFALLLRASLYAQNSGHPAWDFAIAIGTLRDAGMTDCDLRWLAIKGYLDHALDGLHGSRRPASDVAPRQRFTDRSSFVLTARGQRFVECLLERTCVEGCRRSVPARVERGATSSDLRAPWWDPQLRELSVGRTVIKRYCVPAVNQEKILSAFQEEAWPTHIDDPLPPAPGMDSKRRLHSTIQCLNRNQKAPLVRFHGDGYGRGIRWELLSA